MADGESASWRWVRDEEAERRGLSDAVEQLDALQPYPGDASTLLYKIVVERDWVQRLGRLRRWGVTDVRSTWTETCSHPTTRTPTVMPCGRATR